MDKEREATKGPWLLGSIRDFFKTKGPRAMVEKEKDLFRLGSESHALSGCSLHSVLVLESILQHFKITTLVLKKKCEVL